MYFSKKLSIYLSLFLMSACTSTPPSTEATLAEKENVVTPAAKNTPPPSVWFSGKPEQAMALAKTQNKLVFLYWGAVWCPTCNELKVEVFSKPSFVDLMQNFVPLYLDGDTEEAQNWGERLAISGYPTILVLSPEGKELLRINASLNEEEFNFALQPILQKSRSFASALLRLEQGKALPDDWRILAYTSWDQLPGEKFSILRLINAAKLAADRCPQNMPRERAIFAANLLNLAANFKVGTELPVSLMTLKNTHTQYLSVIFADSLSIQTSRQFINNSSDLILRYLYPDSKTNQAYLELKKRWLSAARSIAANPINSIDTRLGAVVPSIEFFRFENPDGPMDPSIKMLVQKAVADADQNAKTALERQAVIAHAGQLLRQVGDFDAARTLLVAEAGRSATPWYYYSSLATLEQELKNNRAAQIWAGKARQTAQGRATKFEWITNDLLLNAKLKGPEQRQQLLVLMKAFYEGTTSLSDGFSGRNWQRAERVREALKEWQQDPSFVEIIKVFEKRCLSLGTENQGNCQKHFALLKK